MGQPSCCIVVFQGIERLPRLPHADAWFTIARGRAPGAIGGMLAATLGQDTEAVDGFFRLLRHFKHLF
jgi:hypothetical protein